MKLLLLGATGLVGSKTLELALERDEFSQVIAPTRKLLLPNAKLLNLVGPRLEELVPSLMSHEPDAVICALGTTQAKAGSKEAFRYVDHELPVIFGRAAHVAGVTRYAIVTAMGASTSTRNFYYRVKGEVERDVQRIGFQSLVICRPSLIAGKRLEARRLEQAALAAMGVLSPLLPRKFRVNPADVIAASLLDAIISARPGCHWIYAEEMNQFSSAATAA